MPDNLRLYSPRGIALGTLIGSLAAAAVMLWMNYRALGYGSLANKVAAAGLAVYLLIVAAASVLPDDPLFALVFMAAQTGLAYWAAQLLQGEAIRYQVSRGARVHSLPWSAGVGLLAGLTVLMVIAMFASVVGVSVPVAPASP